MNMNRTMMTRISLVATLAVALVAVPATADAQGRGNGKGRDRDTNRPELIRRGEDRRADDRRWDDQRRGDRPGPAFCRSGAGHPVHGRQWCRDKGFGLGGDVLFGRTGRVDDRRSDVYGSAGSYERAHQDFHLRHDRQCRMRAAERPLDIQWQIRVRGECKQRHDEWHYRAGRRHE
jgi:hypothetical protein